MDSTVLLHVLAKSVRLQSVVWIYLAPHPCAVPCVHGEVTGRHVLDVAVGGDDGVLEVINRCSSDSDFADTLPTLYERRDGGMVGWHEAVPNITLHFLIFLLFF